MLKNIIISAIILISVIVQSCSDTNDLHEKYLNEGEIVYAAKVDSVEKATGRNRILLNILIQSQRIETVRIFWNDYADSADVQIDSQTGIFSKLLEDMEEKTYIFQFVSIDQYGNKSLPFEVDGEVYGDNFQNSISNRVITSANVVNGELSIEWSGAVDYGLYCYLVYKNSEGEEASQIVFMSETETVLTDWGSDLKYNTAFVPKEGAIDTFYTGYKVPEIAFMYDKEEWTVTTDSYEATGQLPNGAPEKTIDNDESTYWHTQHSGGMPGYPHWLAYDMKEDLDIAFVGLTSRSDYLDADFTNFTVQKSNDGVNWEDCHSFEQEDTAGEQVHVLSEPIKTRYIRIYMTEGPNSYTHLAEFSSGTYIQ